MTGLETAAVERIAAVGTPRTYRPRSYVFHEGEASTGVFVVESGLLRADRSTRSGKVVLLDLEYRDSLIGELSVIDESHRSAALSTVTEATLHYVSAQRFAQLLRDDPELQWAVMRRLVRRLRALSTQFLENSAMDAPARIAARLLQLVEIEQSLGGSVLGNCLDLRLLISQADLAQWAGLSREGAVKALATLRTLGLIETGRMRVLVRDVAALRALADNG